MFLFRRRHKKKGKKHENGGDGDPDGRSTSAEPDEFPDPTHTSIEQEKSPVQRCVPMQGGVQTRKPSEELILPPPQNILQQIAAEEGQNGVRDYVQEWGLAMSEEDITLATVATTVSSMATQVAKNVGLYFARERERASCQEVVRSALPSVVTALAENMASQVEPNARPKAEDPSVPAPLPSSDVGRAMQDKSSHFFQQ
jgi:hypothetical protein